jgi:E3 ubiquitin-protein ligase SHPRH
MCKFFIASAYYQIKTNTELTVPDSEEFKALERLEEDTYEAAKLIRREMLSETNRKVTRYINLVREKVEGKGLVEIPEMSLDVEEGGIESRRIVDRVDEYCDIMNKQAAQFIKWRGCMSKLLLQPLIDEEDGAELQGDEYESSTKHQDELYVYMEALRVMFANLHDSVNGQTNVLIAHEIRQGLEMARQGGGPSPELYISVMNTCKELAVPMEIGSLRDILSELRSLVTSLGGQEIRGSSRARAELVIVNGILRDVGKTFSVHTKILSTLEREVELFRGVMNRRLEYYRQLQQISDTVAPYDEESRGKPLDVEQFELKKGMEDRIESKISSLRAKHRYLIHLRDESGADESQRICIICQSSFEIGKDSLPHPIHASVNLILHAYSFLLITTGVLTVCGHKYCKDCLRLWWHQHRTCPTCKTHLRTNDFHQITYKSMDIVAQEEKTAPALAAGDSRGNSHTNSIYEDVSSGVLQEIKNIDIRGSFGTKIDTLARHLIWLRQHDPGAKSIVFSQYKNFLQTLASAFSRFRIGYASIDSRDGIERFKRDSSVSGGQCSG